MLHRFLLLFGLIGLAACGPKLERVEETDVFGHKIISSINPRTSKREGLMERFDPAGSLVERAYYKGDLLTGPRVLFSAGGDTILIEHYAIVKEAEGNASSIFSGPYRAFYEPSGELRNQGQYVNNAMAGIWYRYYPNGQAAEAVTFADNEEEGPFWEWHENGQLKAEGNYKPGGREDGPLHLYNEQGALERVMQCTTGLCRTVWTSESPEAPPASPFSIADRPQPSLEKNRAQTNRK